MNVGYARTSTIDQQAGYEAQIADLKAAGCQEIFSEQISSLQKREVLERALQFVRKGDTLVVTKLDRLARSIPDLVRIMARLEEREASLRILDMNIDTSAPTGKLLLNLVGAISQFEREIMLERQRIGVAKAKVDGKYKGRQPTARSKSDDVMKAYREGSNPSQIVKSFGISRASVYRIIGASIHE